MRPAQKEIPPCPAAGEGVHGWLMRAGWACRQNGMSAQQAADELARRMTRRPNPPNEIEAAVAKVYETRDFIIGDRSRVLVQKAQKWPAANAEQIEEVAASGIGLVDLWEASPVRVDENVSAGDILRELFPGDPLLCIGTRYQFATIELSKFATSADAFELIVPSPMLSKYGRTKCGKISQHTLEATGPRRFIVIEGDKVNGEPIPKDTQAAVLAHLAEKWPMTLACDSGGKSLHGWFYCAGQDEAVVHAFFRQACALGADPALWTRSQFARMPGGTRSNGKPQPIFYFNPSTLK